MYVAIDIGGTKVLLAVYGEDGTIKKTSKMPTNPSFHLFMEELHEAIAAITKNTTIKAIGVAAPGRVDYETGEVMGFGNLNWKNVDIISSLHNEYSVPVVIDNDGNLGAVGEANMGAAVGADTVLYVTVSTGIGTGITYKGFVDRAMTYSEGGHMHFRHEGKLEEWESFASGKAFVRRFGGYGKDIADPEIWKEYAEDLSMGFGSLISVIQPDIIVIGGSMGEHLEKYRDYLLHALQQTRSSVIVLPSIVAAKFPNEAVINGCYIAAKRAHESART